MKTKISHLLICAMAGMVFFSCQGTPENRKVAPVSSEKMAAEINKAIPQEATGKEHPGKAVYVQLLSGLSSVGWLGCSKYAPATHPRKLGGERPRSVDCYFNERVERKRGSER